MKHYEHRVRRAVLGSVVAFALAVGAFATTQVTPGSRSEEAASEELSADLVVSDQELASWTDSLESEEGREAILEDLQAAFADVADVQPGSGEESVPFEVGTLGEYELVLAYGATWTHFWITASYLDVAQGAIWIAVRSCVSRGIPSWLCYGIGNTLTSWARGWGYSASHGVWGAVYWAPPRITGGRW